MISERKNATVKPQLQKSAAKRNTDCLLLSCKLPSQEEEKNILQLLRSQQQQEKDSVESMAETMSEQMKVRRLCARIAARIKAGDRVPLQDRRYLKRKDPIQYLMATLKMCIRDRKMPSYQHSEKWENISVAAGVKRIPDIYQK